MASIIDFLKARIAEDEALAQGATAGPWRYNPRKVWYRDEAVLARARAGSPFVSGGEEFVAAGPDDGNNETTVGIATTGPEDHPQSMADAAHIAHWDPARVLAECEAKRAIVEHAEDMRTSYEADEILGWGSDSAQRIAGKDGWLYPFDGAPLLRALAAAYRDHPDYQPEWGGNTPQ